MAFGKSTEIKKNVNQVEEDLLWRYNLHNEERANANWERKWYWVLKEYKHLSEKLQEISKKSNFLSDVNVNLREPDLRSIKPIPPTTSGQYGWIANLHDFKLEKYGPDIPVPMELPKDFRLIAVIDKTFARK